VSVIRLLWVLEVYADMFGPVEWMLMATFASACPADLPFPYLIASSTTTPPHFLSPYSAHILPSSPRPLCTIISQPVPIPSRRARTQTDSFLEASSLTNHQVKSTIIVTIRS
jgi:hypothetical protein